MLLVKTLDELADDVGPGEELGLIGLRDGQIAGDVVIASCAAAPNRPARLRTVGVVIDGEISDYWYETTHGDSGHLLASLSSNDVIVS